MSDKQMIEWVEGFVPPPEIPGKRYVKMEYREPNAGEYIHVGNGWNQRLVPGNGFLWPVAIYEDIPEPILCPECGSEMELISPYEKAYYYACCSDGGDHFTCPCKSNKEEALAAAECLRGLWKGK